MSTSVKLQRPGYTETTLLVCHFLRARLHTNLPGTPIGLSDEQLKGIEEKYIHWLFSTSGFYDKAVRGTYFDINCDDVSNSHAYHEWIRRYENSLRDCDYLIPLIHLKYFSALLVDEYINSLSSRNRENAHWQGYWWDHARLYPLLAGKTVLVVSSFAELIEQQYRSGNVHRIHATFPVLRDLIPLTFPYTFLNNGPDSDALKTLDRIYHQICSLDFDIALISCGSYGCILADLIHSDMRRDAVTLGSGIGPMFGIDPRKDGEKFWISEIPAAYRPPGYDKIEEGRYWIKPGARNDRDP
jgi:hypothetical protein